jgi:5'-nucleotidase
MARILITNDDGIDAPGIAELGRAVRSEGHDVVLLAPLHEASGSGAAIGFMVDGTRIRYEERSIAGLEGVTCIGIEGPPARCVLLAFLEAFGARPELVLSGVNPGINTGRGLIHSGTVGAVLAAADFGISGMAVSIDVPASHPTALWSTATHVVLRSLPHLLDAPRKTALNINVPNRPFDEIAGVRAGRISAFGPSTTGVVHDEPGLLRITVSAREGIVLKPDTDTALVAEGYIAVTSLVTPRAVDSAESVAAMQALLGWTIV